MSGGMAQKNAASYRVIHSQASNIFSTSADRKRTVLYPSLTPFSRPSRYIFRTVETATPSFLATCSAVSIIVLPFFLGVRHRPKLLSEGS